MEIVLMYGSILMRWMILLGSMIVGLGFMMSRWGDSVVLTVRDRGWIRQASNNKVKKLLEDIFARLCQERLRRTLAGLLDIKARTPN